MQHKITTPSDLRLALMKTIEQVLDGELSVAHAKTVADLSEQVHKSIHQEWGMRVYAHEYLSANSDSVVQLIGNDDV